MRKLHFVLYHQYTCNLMCHEVIMPSSFLNFNKLQTSSGLFIYLAIIPGHLQVNYQLCF